MFQTFSVLFLFFDFFSGNYTATVSSCSELGSGESCEDVIKTFSCFDSVYKTGIRKECHEEMEKCPNDIIHAIDANQNEAFVYILMKAFKVNSPFR